MKKKAQNLWAFCRGRTTAQRSGFFVCKAWQLFLFLAGCLVISLLPPPAGATSGPFPEKLSAAALREQFSAALRQKDAGRMRTLAQSHPHLWRPVVLGCLSEYSRKTIEGDKGGARESLNVAAALSRLSRSRFLTRLVQRSRSWSVEQHARKVQADADAGLGRTAFDEGRYGDVGVRTLIAAMSYLAVGDVAGEGEVLHYQGQAERRLAQYQAARISHQRALDVAREAGDRFGQGRAFIDLGDVAERQKDERLAAALYRHALKILRAPEDWPETGRALRQLGDVHVAKGDFEAAYREYSRALSYAQEVGDPVYVAQFQDYLGFCHRRLGDLRQAREHHRLALEQANRIAAPAAQAAARARAFNHLGICLAELAEQAMALKNTAQAVELWREALEYEEQALAAAEQVKDRWRLGSVLRTLSLIHRQLGTLLPREEATPQWRKALARAQQALDMAVAMQEKEWQGLALHYLALAQGLLGDDAQGLATFRQAIDLWQGIGDLYSLAQAQRLLAQHFHEPRQRWGEARQAYEQVHRLAVRMGDKEMEALALLHLAHTSAKEGKVEEASSRYEEGLKGLEKVRSRAGFLEFKQAFLEKVYHRYEEATLFFLANRRPELAFRSMESTKARVFLDQLAEARVDVAKGIAPPLKKKRDHLEEQLAKVSREIISAHKQKPVPEDRIASLTAEQERLTRELEALRKQIRLQNPLYASVQYPKPIDLPDLQQKVLRQDEVLLEYFLSPQGVYAFIITPGRYEVVKIADSDREIQDEVSQLLKNVGEEVRQGKDFDRTIAQKLHKLLLAPVAGWLDNRTLIIVPDGVLARLPFEMLVVPEAAGQGFLLEKNRIKYVQSASVLALLRTQYRREGVSDRFIGFGDPVYDYENFRQGKPEDRGGSPAGSQEPGKRGGVWRKVVAAGCALCRLEGTGQEVARIGQIFAAGGKGHQEKLRQDAKEELAKGDSIRQYGYIHLAAHGILNADFQAIVLSQVPDGKEDGFLTLGEIMNCKYQALLVVLSACQTGLGSVKRGEGVTGLTRAVMYAGSPAVVVSLWSVSDEGTRELMVRFYENLIQRGLDKEEALRAAKLSLQGGEYGHPFFWAAFVMYGE
jgi:CHAT domain-containing protein/tetratricopeptide (TPR) repeat protein